MAITYLVLGIAGLIGIGAGVYLIYPPAVPLVVGLLLWLEAVREK